MKNKFLLAILLIVTFSSSYCQTAATENINIFGVDFILLNNRKILFRNNSNSIRVVEVQEITKTVMSYSNIKWENKMNANSEDQIFLTKENSIINLVVRAEYANDKEISFTYKLR